MTLSSEAGNEAISNYRDEFFREGAYLHCLAALHAAKDMGSGHAADSGG